MSHPIPRPVFTAIAPVARLLALAAFATVASCSGGGGADDSSGDSGGSAPPPDTLSRVGDETAHTVDLWVEILAAVETEESARAAAKQLAAVAQQFDALAERALALPKLSPAEYKRVDDQIDRQIRAASQGLETERARIFALPDAIKREVLPAHDAASERFRSLGRSVLKVRADHDTPDADASADPPAGNPQHSDDGDDGSTAAPAE